MSLGLRDELLNLKGKLENLETELTNQMMELEVKAEEWHVRDEQSESVAKTGKDTIITLDIGGKKFQTKLDTLLSLKDTLFYKIFLSGKIDVTKEIFIDRNYTYFNYILSYLRNRKLISSDTLTNTLVSEILAEAEFYQVQELIDILTEIQREIKYVKFTVLGPYSTAGTQNIEDLNNYEDRSCMKGICSTGWIILELNREVEFEEMEVGGWAGNSSLWGVTNGSSVGIETSIDGVSYSNVGNMPSSLSATVQKIKLIKSKCKFVKFAGGSYTGLGYAKIHKL